MSASVKNATAPQFAFSFQEQNTGGVEPGLLDNDISAIMKPKTLDTSNNSVEESFDLKFVLENTGKNTLTKIDEECESSEARDS